MPRHIAALQSPINPAVPQLMHIDLNSCFAMVEQQARPLLRGRPVGVTNRKTKNACVVAASYEAKRLGVKVGMPFSEAKLLAPDMILVETDPPKYHYVYQKLVNIMKSYSPNVTMKSIDEGIINFTSTGNVNKKTLEAIGYEIKQRLKEDVGGYMTCNIGIAPNRFLAKTAAGLHKPDGLDIIDHTNLRQTLATLKLTDLTGIASRNEARLNAAGIYTALQFLDAPSDILARRVFKSVCGEDWYQRLRGWEVDDFESTVRTVGRQFVLDEWKPTEEVLRARLSYLCETTAMKLRYKGLAARGVVVYLRYANGDHWHERKIFRQPFFSNADVLTKASLVFNRRPRDDWVREMSISCYNLEPSNMDQVSLLEEVNREVWLTEAVDTINNQFGEFTITLATSLPAKGLVKQKIPFGSTRYFELLCNRA
ncbi:MAG: Nucleotidyltransferase/DNA polymerase involved in repair [Candidatus Saccharibacteria bacterium]|nr:Nucleotidyltransferase/DNA polymerase involved in repair [Candidatus Saccharibacteria bacterium]